MTISTSSLPSLQDDTEDIAQISIVRDLPEILPRFYIPALQDKPQNPIVDGLKFLSFSPGDSFHPPSQLPPELAVIVQDAKSFSAIEPSDTLWVDAAKRKREDQCQIMSWDALRHSSSSEAAPTPFLSEQSPSVFASVQYHVQPILHNPMYVSQYILLKSLRMSVLGTSSTLHIWDPVSEAFVGHGGPILIDGKNEVVSESFMKRFLTIGTLLRRLESLVDSLRNTSTQAGPTLHAFAHALLSIIAYLREALAKSPSPSNIEVGELQQYMLSAVWFNYAEHEDVLAALASLCNREIELFPPSYPTFDSRPAPLLSRIYAHLNTHIERQSPRIIIASLAFILTATSHDYIQRVCHSVGLGSERLGLGHLDHRNKPAQTTDLFDDDQEDVEGCAIDDLFEGVRELDEQEFPDFFGAELTEALVTARRSLVLLRAAQPDHPLLTQPVSQRDVAWLWTKDEIEAAWAEHTAGSSMRDSSRDPCVEPPPGQNVHEPDLAAQFKIFDLDPSLSVTSNILFSTSDTVESFISNFPACLPSLTPTLAHVNALSFAPLISHASSLSRTLLCLFLSPGHDSRPNLNFSHHLQLMRSYLLLTSHAFKSRLAAALFSDSEEYDDAAGSDPRTRVCQSATSKHNGNKESDRPWAVGLAPALTDRETWPPGGADLSFFLRTVIVDSLDVGRGLTDDQEWDDTRTTTSTKPGVMEEAEFRLGFAIRDLPVGAGRDRWLNPTSIEALDFLYIDYKPPHPLDVLITPEILSKYQRLFAFILRMMRVEYVSKAFFRMTRKNTESLFPTLISSNKLLLHFRFITHSFVTSLSTYVFDTAIGGNFDAFLARLSLGTHCDMDDTKKSGFPDVFALASTHSTVLDNILSACLLRSGQKAAGDLLRGALELVLELGILAGDLRRRRLEEYQAAPLLKDLYDKFRSKMSILTNVLKALVDKGSTLSRLQLEAAMKQTTEGDSRRPPGGAESLYHLLIRLDLGDWWANSHDQ